MNALFTSPQTSLHFSTSDSMTGRDERHNYRRRPSPLPLKQQRESGSSLLPDDLKMSLERTATLGNHPSNHDSGQSQAISDKERSSPREQDRTPTRAKSASAPVISSRNGKDKQHSAQRCLFPPMDQADSTLWSVNEPERSEMSSVSSFSQARPRSRTNPSQQPKRSVVIPPLRSSTPSMHTPAESPPQTPVDSSSIHDAMHTVRVVVAAPIAGVETMDALVDGMNAFDDDDFYKRVGSGSKIGKIAHHPLYHPPLPTPPPGVILGGGQPRKTSPYSSHSDDEADSRLKGDISTRSKSRPRQPSSSRVSSEPPVALLSRPAPLSSDDFEPMSTNPSIDDIIRKHVTVTSQSQSKTVVPSISEIIRKNTSLSSIPVRSRSSLSRSSSYGHTTLHDDSEPEPEPLSAVEEAELLSRSSIDSIAEEVQQTLRKQVLPPCHKLHHAQSFTHCPSEGSGDSTLFKTPRSDARRGSSIYSSSISTVPPLSPSPSPEFSFASGKKPSPKDEIATYLRSKRITTLLKLTHSPHASREHPLTVSLSDLGSPTGFPLVVFLGLGCVRYVMGLYDDMAECLGLRLIAIDRWGLGRTGTPRSNCPRGIPEWATIVDEVLDLLHIDQCSVMAHSAGAPYALSFANRYPERIIGNICLLAPWVGGDEGGGYKWLKYVPNGLLKTAQAAEWKIQAWMIGKPPNIAYAGIGYDVKAPLSSSPLTSPRTPSRGKPRRSRSEMSRVGNGNDVHPSESRMNSRPSMSSGSFSEYDDLTDFDGRFESRSTLGPKLRVFPSSTSSHHSGDNHSLSVGKKKASRGFLRLWKGGINTQSQLALENTESKQQSGKKLKTPKSVGSLKGVSSKPASAPGTMKSLPPSPLTPESEYGSVLSLDKADWKQNHISTPTSRDFTRPNPYLQLSLVQSSNGPRLEGRRSISFSTTTSSQSLGAPSSPASFIPATPTNSTGASYQTGLGNALLAASHAESFRGTHADLLQILNHDRKPWGFSYSQYPHKVKIWYGDKDERITENAVRWMEKTMGESRCDVKVVKGADHGLMYRSSVVVDVLEHVKGFWRDDE